MNTAGRLVCTFLIAAAIAASLSAQNLQVTGKILGNPAGKLALVDIATKTTQPILSSTGVQYSGHHANFSPDGRRIAFVDANAIHAIDNNGANREKICDLYSTRRQNLNWCEDGYIYWCEVSNAIYRVNVATKQREIYWNSPNIQGYSSTVIEDMTVSRDGVYGACRGSGNVQIFNVRTRQYIKSVPGGCSGWMSSGGDRVVHPHTCCIAAPPGITSYMQTARIWRWAVQDSIDRYIHCPGQPYGPETDRFGWHRFAWNNNDYVVGVIEGTNSVVGEKQAIVHDVRSGEWVAVPFNFGWDSYVTSMWIGELPSPSATTPVIALSPTSLSLSAALLSAPVTVSNTGTGTLGTLTVVTGAAWLQGALSGSGNSRTLTLTAAGTGLAAGVYNTTVQVSGGGASNTATVTVQFTVGAALRAPADIAVSNIGAVVTITWTDNNTTESGYAVERSSDGAIFSERRRTAANAQSAIDTLPGAGNYYYRVRAFAATTYSAWTEAIPVSYVGQQSIAISAPTAADTLVAGAPCTIRWTAQNVNAVFIDYSVDGGEYWTRMTSEAIFNTSPTWGAYPWNVPAQISGQVIIRVINYNEQSMYVDSDPVTVRLSSSVRAVNSLNTVSAVMLLQTTPGSVTYALRLDQAARISVLALDGALRDEVRVGKHSRSVTLKTGTGSGARILRVQFDDGTVLTRMISMPMR